MNRDDIIRMAREAEGIQFNYRPSEEFVYFAERFAALVAAHTLANIDPSKFISHQEGLEAGRLIEREACAQLCLETEPFYGVMFAEVIRARGAK
jgi:hypothetical protein